MKVQLKEQMEAYRRRTGEPMTYAVLAARAGVSRASLESLATRQGYNATLATIERICVALGCGPGDLLKLEPAAKTAA